MGMDVIMYLGPLARCRIERVSKSEKGCLKEGCRMFHVLHSHGDFCSTCGSPYGKFEVPNVVEKVDYRALFGLKDPLDSYLNGDGQQATHRLFVPSGGRGRPRSFKFNPECDFDEVSFTGNQQMSS